MKWLFAMLLYCAPVYTVPISRDAEAYFEAKNYEMAFEHYERLAQEPSLLPWQKGVVQYNLAVSQIALGDWDEALRTLQQIQTSSPYVLMHIQATLAYIHLHLAETRGVKDDETTLNWLRSALYEVDDASKTHCALQKIEGREDCNASAEIAALQKAIEVQWSHYSDEKMGTIDPVETRIYLEAAKHWLIKAQRSDHDPLSTLKYAIEDQEHALALNRLYQRMHHAPSPFYTLILETQKKTLKTAEPFYSEVLEKERREYPERCQCRPWDSVIPPFEEGYRRAKWMLPIIAVQEEILRYWKLSLENATKQVKPEVQPKEESEKSQTSIKEVFREIEKMDQDDRLPKQKVPVSIEGIKPW